ncbi:MAG: 8-amino-7-oxononanoate synthase [Gammaproteobacteria bacterium]|nr:8-amino-7-oxononanoate synthase [Candidatus Thioaporhodococcus sediminis]TNF57822.1 MAG: 8-amino-7-oxononanoate synthase [Gammaproteobacteria bacterium]
MRDLNPELGRRRAAHLYRRRRLIADAPGPRLTLDGRPAIAFCTNDYLGLARHPEVVAACQRGADQYGVGSGSAHLVAGHGPEHQALEEELADFLGRPRALLFSTGYMANLGVIQALAGPGDRVFEDKLNHASLIDGALLARARLRRYPHGDLGALRRQLQVHAEGTGIAHPIAEGNAATLIATDGVFSMDGDLAPLPELAAIVRAAGAWLLVDDAHGIGVLGREGRGSLEHFGLGVAEVPILVGTLGKALGTFGAFVAGGEDLIETLIQSARSYIYTTAPPPALAAATRASLSLARREDWRRERLRALIGRFRAEAARLGLPLLPSPTPIQPILAGSAERALAWSQALEDRGLLVTAIRPPTVPIGSARLRVTFSALHTDQDLERLLEALADLSETSARLGAPDAPDVPDLPHAADAAVVPPDVPEMPEPMAPPAGREREAPAPPWSRTSPARLAP